MLDIKPLRYFVTLAQTRHFGRAATQLHLSQPPLSRQLAALEAALGVRLLERNTRSVTLTRAGERFLVDAQAILNALEQAQRNALAAASGEAGALSIGFTMCAAYSVVPRYARSFGAAFPEVALQLREIVSNDLAAQVTNGRIDAAIMFPGEASRALTCRTVVSEPLCVALPRDHRLARARRLRAAQLSGEPFVMVAPEVAPGLRGAIVDQCRQAGFDPDVRFEVQLQQTILSLVAEGVGLAMVPASMKRSQPVGVVFKPLVDAPLIDQVLAWSSGNRNPCLARFLDLVADRD